jgi:glycosyltransferase involved in cell wall biosynthesis
MIKKIGIDARLYSQTGVGVYLRNLIYYLQKIETNNVSYYIYILDEDCDKISLSSENFILKKVTEKWHSLSEQTIFLKKINNDHLDLMHFPYFSYPLFYKRKFITTIHDLTPIFFKTGKASTQNPLIYQFKHKVFEYLLANQVFNSEAIITPTITVKNQLKKLYGEKLESKIYPLYEGFNYELVDAVPTSQTLVEGDFFLYVGNFYPHKNVDKLIEAFSSIKEDIKLIFFGPNDFFSKKIKDNICKRKLEKKIIFFHNYRLSDLAFFYNNAKALIHPSLSEGFGLPIVEAINFGLPIIASDIPVFREILGNKGYFFNPESSEEIKNKINLFLKEKKLFDYSDLRKKYSFLDMTKKTIKIYEKFL